MRGLKLKISYLRNQRKGRIFYRCVDWNDLLPVNAANDPVASFTDAWIETNYQKGNVFVRRSHLLQMRGLKHPTNKVVITPKCRIFYRCVDWNLHNKGNTVKKGVASFTDAWIETCKQPKESYLKKSHLLQMRGLKRDKGFHKMM